MGRGTSRRKIEQNATEDVGCQLLLSFALLEGLLPIGGGELEDASFRPAREQAEEIADVAERLDVVQASAGEERDEAGVGHGAVVAADEEPVAAPDDLAAQVELGDVVVDGQPPVIEKALEGDALVARVRDRRRDRRLIEDGVDLGVAPFEEFFDNGARLGAAHLFFLLSRRVRDGPLELEQRADVREGDLGSLRS